MTEAAARTDLPAGEGAGESAEKRRARRSRRLRTGVQVVLLILVFLVAVFPFYWMVTTSLKTQQAALASPPEWIFDPTLKHYADALFRRDVLGSLINSLIVAVSTTALAIAIGAPAAYALARYEFKAKRELFFWFVTNRMISPIVLALPVFLMARWLDLMDTHLVLILIYLTFNLPVVVWLCTDQFASIPHDLEEAARLDGASRFTIFTRIALPLAAPGIAVSAIFSFIFSWNELLYALILTRSDARTAPVAATSYMSGYKLPWGEIMATGSLIAIPVVVFALVVSRQMVRGLTLGAVK
jgi:multiple sugar transport system permease protein